MSKVMLHFYVEEDGRRAMGDSFIMGLLDRAEKDGVLENVFYGDSKYTKDRFLYKLKNEPNVLLAVVTIEDEVAGFVVLDHMTFDNARFHFCAFSEFWGKEILLEASTEVYKQLHQWKFSLLYGVIPIDNKFALSFCDKLNLKRACVLPKYFYNDKLDDYVDGVQFISVRED